MYAHSSGSYTFPDGYLHNGYLIFIEVLSIRNSVCAINSRVNPKNIADSKQKHMWVKVEAGIFGGGIGLHFWIWLPHHRFWRAGWTSNELRRLSFTGTVQIFKMDMLKRYNFFIDVLIFTCGLYSVASLEDNGECLYNVEWCTWHGSSQYYNI